MKKVLIIEIILILLSGVSLGCGVSQEEFDAVIEERNTLIQEKDAAEVEISNLINQVTSLEDEIDTLKKVIEAFESSANSPDTPGVFSKYGFSFSYPTNYSIDEMGMFGDSPNNDSGIIRAIYNHGQNVFQVIWINVNPDLKGYMPDCNDLLNTAFYLMNGLGLKNITKGNVSTMNIARHTMVYQVYSSTVLNQKCSGVASVFYCDTESRYYQFVTLRIGNYSTQENIDYFQSFTESFAGQKG